jgi:hypothetical protein
MALYTRKITLGHVKVSTDKLVRSLVTYDDLLNI